MLVFSIRIFPIAAAVCLFGVLPLNYYGQYRHHLKIPSESLDFFTIGNVQQGSRCLEGLISHSGRKRSACSKVLYFTVWNVFFVNVFSGSIISQLNTLSSPKEIPTQLAKAVPSQATIFITYVLTSGWASLSSEVIQLLALIWNFTRRCVFRRKGDPSFVPSVPYQTEVPRVLLFWLLGFTCAILSPLILPFLLVYLLGYVVYRNQDLLEMDIGDEKCGRIHEIHQQLQTAYCQFFPDISGSCEGDGSITREVDVKDTREVDVKDCLEDKKL